MSFALNNKFDDAPGELECPLEVMIVDDHPMRVSRVNQYVLLSCSG